MTNMALPSGYTLLDWIGSSGTQYINTGVNITRYMRVVADVEFNTISSSTSNYLFGAKSSGTVRGIGIASKSNAYYYIYRSATETSLSSTNISGKFNVDYTYNKITFTPVSGSAVSKSLSSNTNTANNPLYIFAMDNAGTVANQSTAKIYSFKIYTGTSSSNMTLQRDFVPAMNSSGVVGLYDLQNNNFYANAGSGTFSYGCSINYITDKGTAPSNKEINVPYSLVASDLPTLSASGYAFGGWYYENTYTTKAKVDDVIYNSITLYAKWLDKFTIHYEVKYGTAPADKIVDAPSYILTTADLPTVSVPGFKATDWYYNNTYTSKANAGDSIVADTTLYAKFVEVPIIVDGKRKIEMKVKLNNTVDATDADYDTLHPITDADLVEYTKNGVLSDVGTVLSTTADNMASIVATATDIEARQHGMFIIAKETEVPNSAWVSNATYSDYPYRASISVAGCNSDYVPDVYFDVADVELNIFAPISETGNNIVYIYAKEKPGKTITIPTIKLATEADKISTVKVLGAIQVYTKPSKIEYIEGETLSYSGMVVKAYYSNGSVATISNYTVNPANGTVLSEGITTCTISYTEDGVTKTDSFNVTVNSAGPTIKPFSECSDEEFLAIAQALQDGTITTSNLPWKVGDTRNVNLSSFQTYSSSTSSTSTQAAQTAQLVILNKGGKTFRGNGTSLDGTTCHYIVGFKDNVCKSCWGDMDNTYSSSLIKTVENNVYNALPSDVKACFKKFDIVTGVCNETTSGETNVTSQQYFTSPAEKEIFGKRTYSTSNEANALSQFTYYATPNNRIHTNLEEYWWERSPYYDISSFPCGVYSDGAAYNDIANNVNGVSPFGCI